MIPWRSTCGRGLPGVDTGGLLEPVYLPSRGMPWKHAALEKEGKPGRIGFPGATVHPLRSAETLALRSPAGPRCWPLPAGLNGHFKLNRPGVDLLGNQASVLWPPLTSF